MSAKYKEMKTEAIRFLLTSSLKHKIEKFAEENDETMTDVITKAVEERLRTGGRDLNAVKLRNIEELINRIFKTLKKNFDMMEDSFEILIGRK